MGTRPWSQLPSQAVAGGKQVRFWQGPWGRGSIQGCGRRFGEQGKGTGEGREWLRPSGSYLVMGVWDAQESMEALVQGQKGPLRPHPKMPLASYPCEIASGSQDLSQGHLLQGQAPSGTGLQNSRVQAHADREPAGQEGGPVGQSQSVRLRRPHGGWGAVGGRQKFELLHRESNPLLPVRPPGSLGGNGEAGGEQGVGPTAKLTEKACTETRAHRSR